MLRSLILLLGLTLVAPAVYAQPSAAETEADTAICVGGPQWFPLSTDTARIDAIPIPASFRVLFESNEPCSRMALNEQHLVDWHLAFGSEQTLTVALDYIERDYLLTRLRPEEYRHALRSAWRLYERDFRRLAQQPPVERSRSVRESEGYQRVDRVVDLDREYAFLAEWSLRGAEEFHSSALLARAERFLTPLVDGVRFVAEHQPAEMRSLGFSFGYNAHRIDDFRLRAAILRARLSGASGDMDAAETLLTAMYRPVFLEAAEATTAEGFCEFEDEPALAALRLACRENNFSAHVMNYWINRAMLDLLRNTEQSQDDLALELLVRAERCCGFSRGYREATEDRRRILLARAERGIRRFDADLARGDRHDAISNGFDALHDLQRAERLISPFDKPRYFREVARAWLQLFARLDGIYAPDDERPPPGVTAMRERYAAYLRHMLAGLDAIATGDHGLPPPRN